MTSNQLQFAPFTSALDGGFWHKFSQLKLEVFRLDDSPHEINASYGNGDLSGLPCRVNVDYTAFDKDTTLPPRQFKSLGLIKNFNTIEDFKECDKKQLLQHNAVKIWSSITSGQALTDASLISTFLVITFADLKKYNYHYWFAFPALSSPQAITQLCEPSKINDRFSKKQIDTILSGYDAFNSKCGDGYFVIKESTSELTLHQLQEVKSFPTGTKFILAFCDPCTLDNHPGWPLRNFLILAAYHWTQYLGSEVEVLCYRERFKDGSRDVSHSIVLKTTLPDLSTMQECPNSVGWEKNERQKLGPRKVNLSGSMDPVMLSESAVDLNLKLMRWRLLPDLDLASVSTSKALLLGAGTLGCNVARCLLGWGVRHITFVDYGRVSYSNPVRQSLFTFEDSLNGGKSKATAAAESLTAIFPGVKAEGISLSIPMPGHAMPESMTEQLRKDVKDLEQLIADHDVIFLLMDSRESRWLPTMIAAAKGKLVMNAALGFDTYLVIRHGLRSAEDSMDCSESDADLCKIAQSIDGTQLGCYFCNDVVAPGNSMRDRTLDQQCTVSRPGLSMIAAALVVELYVSTLQHPQGGRAPAESHNDEHLTKQSECNLGLIPHQLRGFLSSFQQVMPASRRFRSCTACSQMVIDKYKSDGFDFLQRVFKETKYLEDLTGLTELQDEANEIWDTDEFDMDSEED